MTTEAEIARIVGSLTEAQRRMVLASDPDDITGEEGCGVEIRGGGYKVARHLKALGLGLYTHGSPIYDMYWNNALGLAVRSAIEDSKGRD